MTMSSPFTITLTVLDESVLRARARGAAPWWCAIES